MTWSSKVSTSTTVEAAIDQADVTAAETELAYLRSLGVPATTGPTPDAPLLWFVSAASADSGSHKARLQDALAAERHVIIAVLDAAGYDTGSAVSLDLVELGSLTFRERLLWHIEQGNNQIANAGSISRDTRVTRWMLIGLGIFFAILFGSLFHMSYYQI